MFTYLNTSSSTKGLFEALVGLCFNEIASFVHGCQNYLRQRREIEGTGSPAAAGTAKDAAAARSSPKGIMRALGLEADDQRTAGIG